MCIGYMFQRTVTELIIDSPQLPVLAIHSTLVPPNHYHELFTTRMGRRVFKYHQDGRVVKALDLRSNGQKPSWVRTPLLVVGPLQNLHSERYLVEFYIQIVLLSHALTLHLPNGASETGRWCARPRGTGIPHLIVHTTYEEV